MGGGPSQLVGLTRNLAKVNISRPRQLVYIVHKPYFDTTPSTRAPQLTGEEILYKAAPAADQLAEASSVRR